MVVVVIKWYYMADKNGKIREGYLEASSKKNVEQELKKNGLYPLMVKKQAVEVKKDTGRADNKKAKNDNALQALIGEKFGRISDKELGKLFENLEVLLRSNINLTDSWKIVKSNKNSKNMKNFLDEVEKNLNKGYTLSYCLSQYSFMSNLALAIIKTGEEIGGLEDSFRQVSLLYSQKDLIKNKILKAMAYPVFLILTVIVMVYYISTKVLPSLLDSMGDRMEINKVTEMFIFLSELFQNYGPGLLAGIILTVSVPVIVLKRQYPRTLDNIVLNIPLLGPILKKRIEIAVLKNFSLLYGAGVSTLLILDMLRSISKNIMYLENLELIKEGVKKGEPISMNMSEDIYSATAINIFKVSETTGNIVEPFGIVAANAEKQLDESITAFTAVITPVAVVVLAGLVLLLIIGILMPIFSIYNMN